MAFGGVYHSLLCDWIYSAVRQRRSHHCQILGAHVQGTLFIVEVDCLGGVDIDPTVTLQQTGNALVAIIGFGRGHVNFVIKRQSAPSEPRQSFVNEIPFGFDSLTWYQTGLWQSLPNLPSGSSGRRSSVRWGPVS